MSLEDELQGSKKMVIDYSGTDDDFENLDEGWYLTAVTKAGPATSKQGNPLLKVSYKVIDGEEAGRYATSWTNTNGKAAYKSRKVLRALGETVEGKEQPLDPSILVGREVYVHVDDEGWVDDWKEADTTGLE